jgi:hypothetical protein
MANNPAVYQLRLPRSLKAAVEQYARDEGISMNQFMASAVAEKISALSTADFFQNRASRLNYDIFDRVMARTEGDRPKAGDEIS